MTVRLEDAVVLAFQQDLAGFGADRFEVTRRDAFSGNLGRPTTEEALKNLVEARGPVLEKIVVARAIQQPPALVQVIGARLGADQRIAAVEKTVPFRARQPLPAD